MDAELIFEDHKPLSDREVVHMVVWRVPTSLWPCDHDFKYRLALVVDGVCVLCYDNERGKVDHRHVGGMEQPYAFTTLAALLADFLSEVEIWRTR